MLRARVAALRARPAALRGRGQRRELARAPAHLHHSRGAQWVYR